MPADRLLLNESHQVRADEPFLFLRRLVPGCVLDKRRFEFEGHGNCARFPLLRRWVSPSAGVAGAKVDPLAGQGRATAYSLESGLERRMPSGTRCCRLLATDENNALVVVGLQARGQSRQSCQSGGFGGVGKPNGTQTWSFAVSNNMRTAIN